MIVGLDNSGKTSILNHIATHNCGGESRTNPKIARERSSTPVGDAKKSTDSEDLSRQLDRSGSGSNVMPTVGYNYERVRFKGLAFTVLDFSGHSRYRNLWQEFYNGIDGIVFVIDSSDLIRLVVVRDELETMLSHPYFATLTDSRDKTCESMSANPISTPIAAQKQLKIRQGKLIQAPLDVKVRSVPKSQFSLYHGGLREAAPRRRSRVPILFLANKADLANSADTRVISEALNLIKLPSNRHPWTIQATSVKLNEGIIEGFNWLAGQLLLS